MTRSYVLSEQLLTYYFDYSSDLRMPRSDPTHRCWVLGTMSPLKTSAKHCTKQLSGTTWNPEDTLCPESGRIAFGQEEQWLYT